MRRDTPEMPRAGKSRGGWTGHIPTREREGTGLQCSACYEVPERCDTPATLR